MKQPTDSDSHTERRRLWIAVVLIGFVAVLLRVCNLGTFSLWRDEFFTMNVASMPLPDLLSACAADANNPPLYAVITYLSLLIGLVDPWIRLIPIAAALASIGLFALWTDRHFGRTVALLAAVFSVLSPFHVRYSQELRAYPYLLLLCALTLLVVDRLVDRPDWKSTLALAATVALGFYTNLTYALVLVPAAGLAMVTMSVRHGGDPATAVRVRKQSLIGVGLGLCAFLPWLWMIWSPLGNKLSEPPKFGWTLKAVGTRWLSLTIAPKFEGLAWVGIVLVGIFLIGVVVAARTRIGRAVLLPAMAALVAWEVALVIVDRWTRARYDTAMWPFIAILIALGFGRVLRWFRWRWIRWAACAAVTTMLVVHVDTYHRNGRPHWNLVADAVMETSRPGEDVVTFDQFAKAGLTYYLEKPIPTVNKRLHRLRSRFAESPTLLVASKYPLRQDDMKGLFSYAEIVKVHRTGWLYRFRRISRNRSGDPAGGVSEPLESWPEPNATLVSERLERQSEGCLSRLFPASSHSQIATSEKLDFTSSDLDRLRSGWGELTSLADGTTLAWVLEHEASIDIEPGESIPGRISIRLAPHPRLAGDQWIRVLLNNRELGVNLLRGRQLRVIAFDVPAEAWRYGRDLLVMQFSEACCSRDRRGRRSAQVDWIEWTPRQPSHRDR